MLRYQFSVQVDDQTIRRAGLAFMSRRFAWKYIAGWIVVGLSAALYFADSGGLLSTILGVLTATLAVVLVIFPIAIWRILRRMSAGYMRLTEGGAVFYEVDEIGLSSTYAQGSGDMRWSVFSRLQKADDIWLLEMANEDRFIPLPVDQVPEAALSFIERKLSPGGSDLGPTDAGPVTRA